MRSILLLVIILGSVPIILVKPHVGVLVWSWISYMNPHRFAWGWAQTFPVAMIVGVVTMLAWAFSRESKKMPWNAVTVLLVVFILWMCITTVFATLPSAALTKWEEVMKIMLMTFVTLFLINTKDRMNALIWVIVVSIGFYGVKGGIFTIMTGGKDLVLGPPRSFLGSNNGLAYALIMILPLMRYLQLESRSKLVYWALTASMVLCGLSIAASYSRGAFLAAFAMLGLMWLKSRKRFLLGIGGALAVVVTLSFMPAKWYDRMQTIETYEEDKSAITRITMWTFAFEIARRNPVFGGGFDVFEDFRLYPKYGVDLDKTPSVHSVYFEVLGEHGFIGLFLYLLLAVATFRKGTWIIRRARGDPQMAWAGSLAAMLQVAMVGYAVGGLFLNRAYFDLYYHLVGLMVIVQVVLESQIAESPQATVESDNRYSPWPQQPVPEMASRASLPAPELEPATSLSRGAWPGEPETQT